MKSFNTLPFISLFASQVLGADSVLSTGKLELSNVGFAGTYQFPNSLNNIEENTCSCDLGEQEWFSGPNAPLSGYLSVHFTGPIKLNKFAHYTSTNFVIGDNSSSQWSRSALYDISTNEITAENVTFMGHKGDYSPCLGKALTYIKGDGVSASDKPDYIQKYLSEVMSGDEFILFSNISCPKSGPENDCGVYRSGVPAYYGFGGVTKMFFFEFEMPNDIVSGNSTDKNTPAIVLFNDRLPRVTEHYFYENNCSCLFSGCGSYEVFATDSTNKQVLLSGLRTFQGIDKNSTLGIGQMINGTSPDSAFSRATNQTMKGGIIFDSNGNVVTFLSDDLPFSNNITAATLNALLDNLPSGSNKKIQSGSSTAPTSKSKSNGTVILSKPQGIWFYVASLLISFLHIVV